MVTVSLSEVFFDYILFISAYDSQTDNNCYVGLSNFEPRLLDTIPIYHGTEK